LLESFAMPRKLLFLLLLAATTFCAAKDKDKDKDKGSDKPEGWLPVTQQDFAVKDVPNDPGADAIQLYMSYFKDDNSKFISVYKRIRILRESGRERAQVEIPLEPGESLKDLAARTIHPDQSIVEFTGKPMEKTLVKTRGIKYSARWFTMPDVTVGSIIEYRYVLTLPPHRVRLISAWPIQQDLFTLREHLRFRAFQGLVLVPTEWNNVSIHTQVSYAYLNQVDLMVPQKKEGNLMEMEIQNVPKFDSEEYMPPKDDYRPVVLFYYGGREMATPEKFWDEWQKLISEYVEKFIGNSREVREAALQAMGNETDPQKKLRKLYERAQQIRNLSYERERSREEEKSEHIKRNISAQEVLQHGQGTSWDVNALFTALARAAGFEATMLGVSDRTERSFNKLVLWLGQIDSSAVLVKMEGMEVVLSPGTRFAPFGMLPWQNTATAALKFSKSNGGFITTPNPESSLMRRIARVSLAADGSLNGEITVEFNGEDALQHRLEALDQDEAGRRKSLEDEVKSWLPQNAVVKMSSAEGWESPGQPLQARFQVEVPGFASSAGKRLVAPAFFFPTLQKNMFAGQMRHYPIAFPYPFTETDELYLKLPEGYSLEAPPYRRKAGLSYAGYEINTVLEERQLVTRRSLRLDGLQFPPHQYEELRNFFAVVQKGDGGQAVLRAGESEKAEGPK
jgi:Transglutaminase-like superfamily/Domain of Unknown Function with PDB structure (DUF3857)